MSDPIPGAGWSPRDLPKGSLTPHVPLSVPRAMGRNRLRKRRAASVAIRLAAVRGNLNAAQQARVFCKVSSVISVHPGRAR